MGDKFDIEHDLAKLGGPALRLGGARHEARVVVDGLGERGLEEVSGIEHAIVALGEAARPVGADLSGRRHKTAGARRSEVRRVGEAWASKGGYRWVPYYQ